MTSLQRDLTEQFDDHEIKFENQKTIATNGRVYYTAILKCKKTELEYQIEIAELDCSLSTGENKARINGVKITGSRDLLLLKIAMEVDNLKRFWSTRNM